MSLEFDLHKMSISSGAYFLVIYYYSVHLVSSLLQAKRSCSLIILALSWSVSLPTVLVALLKHCVTWLSINIKYYSQQKN